jgi:hypothetical protein
MSAIARINQEINSCQSELVVLFPRQFSMLGEGDKPGIMTADSRAVQSVVVAEHVSIAINLMASLADILHSISIGGEVRVNGDPITGAQFAHLLRRRMEIIKDASVTDKVSSEAVMSSVIGTMAALVQRFMPSGWGQHNTAIVKYLRTSIQYDADLTASGNITTFYERLADRISSIFVLCGPPDPTSRDAVFNIINHMRFYINSQPRPKHSVIVLRLKEFLCGSSLPGCDSSAPLSTIRTFSDAEYTSVECKNMLRLFYLMDTLIGLKRKYTRPGSNEVLEACIKTGRSICTYFVTNSGDGLLKNVCSNIIRSLNTAHARFSEHHNFEKRFGIIIYEVHAGLSSTVPNGNSTLIGIVDILNQTVVLNLNQIKYDLEQIGFTYEAEIDVEDERTPIHSFLNIRYNGDIMSVIIDLDHNGIVVSVTVDTLPYLTPTPGAWSIVLATITDEIAISHDPADVLDPTLHPFTE